MAAQEKQKKRLDAALAGALVIVLAGSAVLIALTREARPEHLPPPRVDWAALGRTQAQDLELARLAQTDTLDVDVRAVGRELRRYNLAAARDDQRTLVEVRTTLVKAVRKALTHGEQPLRSLRAYQALKFMDELRRWTETGQVTEELQALGGDFLSALSRNGWCEADSRKPLMSDDVLLVLYKDRWNDLTALGKIAPFSLTVDEDRVRYAFLLKYPFRRRALGPAAKDLQAFQLGRFRLRIIDQLSQVDEAYPADYARGVVHYQMGRWELAGASFNRHLQATPDGPYTLLARNYLRTSLALVNATR